MTAAELELLACEQRHVLLTIARRRARTEQDAEDAVQQALAIAFTHRERIRPQTAVAYVGVIAQHEASRLRRLSDGLVSLDQPVASGQASRHDALPDDRQADRDAVIDALTALRRAKRDHARALIARALGWRYREICDAFEWTYTKTNRCVTEGRADLRGRDGTPA
jgi:DNA-directed RNA polymerase specialized sigma24 family protein